MESKILELVNSWSKNTLMEHWGIEFIHYSETELWATMPVTDKVKQPFRLLHGGASAALAETIGSSGSALLVDTNKFLVVGLNLSANHIRSTKSGLVTGKGKLVHKGRSTHIWNIDIYNEDEKVLSSCRLTNFIRPI